MEIEKLKNFNFRARLKSIRALIFDVDGVLSASRETIGDDGRLIRTTNVKDGYILRYALRQGLHVSIISGATSAGVEQRYKALGIEDVIMGSKYKVEALAELAAKYNLDYSEMMYMGDDIPDLPLLRKVGMPCCPADAVDDVKNECLYISNRQGGDACVRDIVEKILRAQKLWLNDDDFET